MNEQSQPNPDLKSLDRLIGTWKQSGELDGEITYEWAEGGFFLICAPGRSYNEDTIIRYNISQNDGINSARVFHISGAKNT